MSPVSTHLPAWPCSQVIQWVAISLADAAALLNFYENSWGSLLSWEGVPLPDSLLLHGHCRLGWLQWITNYSSSC